MDFGGPCRPYSSQKLYNDMEGVVKVGECVKPFWPTQNSVPCRSGPSFIMGVCLTYHTGSQSLWQKIIIQVGVFDYEHKIIFTTQFLAMKKYVTIKVL